MRIRRRPQAQALLPSLQQHHSDPYTAPPQPPPPPPSAPRNQRHWLLCGAEGEEGKKRLGEFRLHPNVDLGGDDDEPSAARRAALPLLPQAGNGNMVGSRSGSPGGGAAQPRRQGAAAGADDHSHRSGLENNWLHGRPESATNAGERPVNGVIPGTQAAAVMSLNVKEERKNDSKGGGGGAKKRRGPAVLMEGSRCSRVNGRGWRCSQPTLVGYSLCEHHLGKGRGRTAGGRSGGAQLGRTESGRKKAAAVAVVTNAVPRADEPTSLRHS